MSPSFVEWLDHHTPPEPEPEPVEVVENDDVVSFTIRMDRSELIPGGNGARIAYSNAFPSKQFLIIPEQPDDDDEQQLGKRTW